MGVTGRRGEPLNLEFYGTMNGEGLIPCWVAELNLPCPVGMDISVVGNDVDRARLLLSDEIRKHGANEWGHPAAG